MSLLDVLRGISFCSFTMLLCFLDFSRPEAIIATVPKAAIFIGMIPFQNIYKTYTITRDEFQFNKIINNSFVLWLVIPRCNIISHTQQNLKIYWLYLSRRAYIFIFIVNLKKKASIEISCLSQMHSFLYSCVCVCVFAMR